MEKDRSYIKKAIYSGGEPWHVYQLMLESRYGWDYIVSSADYLLNSDFDKEFLLASGRLSVFDIAGPDIDIKKEIKGSLTLKECESIKRERAGLTLASVSESLRALVQVVWLNQTNVLKIFCSLKDDDLVLEFAERLIRRTFNDPNYDHSCITDLPTVEVIAKKDEPKPVDRPSVITSNPNPSAKSSTMSFEDTVSTVLELLSQDKKMAAIKYVKDKVGVGLKDAKIFVEKYEKKNSPNESNNTTDSKTKVDFALLLIPTNTIELDDSDVVYFLAIERGPYLLPIFDLAGTLGLYEREADVIKQKQATHNESLQIKKMTFAEFKKDIHEYLKFGVSTIVYNGTDRKGKIDIESLNDQKFNEKSFLNPIARCLTHMLVCEISTVTPAVENQWKFHANKLSELLNQDYPLMVVAGYDGEDLNANYYDENIHFSSKIGEKLKEIMNSKGLYINGFQEYFGSDLFAVSTQDNRSVIGIYTKKGIDQLVDNTNNPKQGILHPRVVINPNTRRSELAVFTNLDDVKSIFGRNHIGLMTMSDLLKIAEENSVNFVFNPGPKGVGYVIDNTTMKTILYINKSESLVEKKSAANSKDSVGVEKCDSKKILGAHKITKNNLIGYKRLTGKNSLMKFFHGFNQTPLLAIYEGGEYQCEIIQGKCYLYSCYAINAESEEMKYGYKTCVDIKNLSKIYEVSLRTNAFGRNHKIIAIKDNFRTFTIATTSPSSSPSVVYRMNGGVYVTDVSDFSKIYPIDMKKKNVYRKYLNLSEGERNRNERT